MTTTVLKALVVLLIVTSCEKTIELDVKQTAPQVVIEGLLTDKEGMQYVKVGQTVGFYTTGSTPRITDAMVAVSDDEGERMVFEHNPNDHPDSLGYYLPDPSYKGEIGHTYTLSVTIGEDLYTASDKLLPVTEISALTSEINDEEREYLRENNIDGPIERERYHEVFLFAEEPQERKDFYLFKFYRNGQVLRDDDNEIYVVDDTSLGESIDDIPIAGFFAPREVARVEMFSITRPGFLYYQDLTNILGNDGGMFSPPPANPRSNLSNNALGFFQVSAIAVSTFVIP